MEFDEQAEALKGWVAKNKLDQRLSVGMFGTPELRKEERNQYLGEFKERVLKVLTKEQIAQPFVYPEIEEALKDQRAKQLLLNGQLSYDFLEKYILLADRFKKSFTLRNDPELKGEVGLAVVSSEAIAVESINVEERF